MPLITCKVELILNWKKYCVSIAAGVDNVCASYNNIIFIKGTKLYLLIITLSAKDNQKLSKIPRKGFERSAYWNEYKTKSIKLKTKMIENNRK